MKFLVTGTGKTLEEAKKDFMDGFKEIREFKAEQGNPIEDVEWDWCYDTASFIREYAYAFTLASLSRIIGVNQGVLSHYANGTSRPPQRTRERIKEGISRFQTTWQVFSLHKLKPQNLYTHSVFCDNICACYQWKFKPSTAQVVWSMGECFLH